MRRRTRVEDILIGSIGVAFWIACFSACAQTDILIYLESQVRGHLVNYVPEGCAIPVCITPSCRQWDMLDSDAEKENPADTLMLFFLKARLSGGTEKAWSSSLLLKTFT